MSSADTGERGIEIPDGWALDEAGKAICVRLQLKDFMSAIGLINEIAMIAEELDHHPDIHLTGWNKLEIRTYSHDVDALSDRDTALAARIDILLDRRNPKRL